MDGIILAAGKGTRMGDLTHGTPKPLLRVKNKPILEYSLRSLRPSVDRVIIVVSYLGEQIEEFMNSQNIFSDYQIAYQDKPLGTGHALKSAEEYINSFDFIAINGDDLYDATSVKKLSETELGVLTLEKDDPTQYGVVVTDKSMVVQRLHEKPPAGLYKPPANVNIGAYKLNRNVFDIKLTLSKRGEYEITEYVTELAKLKKVTAVKAAFWMAVGTPEQLSEAQNISSSQLK